MCRVQYIVAYILETQKGTSEILWAACDEARSGNASIKQQVRDMGNKFLNNVDISAQGAVCIVLQSVANEEIVSSGGFVNASPPEDRVKLLRWLNDIKRNGRWLWANIRQ